jgi:hypothetical protein
LPFAESKGWKPIESIYFCVTNVMKWIFHPLTLAYVLIVWLQGTVREQSWPVGNSFLFPFLSISFIHSTSNIKCYIKLKCAVLPSKQKGVRVREKNVKFKLKSFSLEARMNTKKNCWSRLMVEFVLFFSVWIWKMLVNTGN